MQTTKPLQKYSQTFSDLVVRNHVLTSETFAKRITL